MANPCPTVRELFLAVGALTREHDGTFQNRWAASFPNAQECCEQGGFIYIDFPVPNRITRAYVSFAPQGILIEQRTWDGPNGAIDLNQPGIDKDNVILVANFHTHPISVDVGGVQPPSPADVNNAYYRGVPGIVVSRNGIYSYGPNNRVDVTNPKGYPGGTAPPINPPITLELGPRPPWTVPTQWPEGTGRRSKDIHMKRETRFGNDVVVLEWSDEDVVYGEPLVEG